MNNKLDNVKALIYRTMYNLRWENHIANKKNAALLSRSAQNTPEPSSIGLKKNTTKAIIFVVYGQNVNAGTTNMSGAIRLSKLIKKKFIYKNLLYRFSCSSFTSPNTSRTGKH